MYRVSKPKLYFMVCQLNTTDEDHCSAKSVSVTTVECLCGFNTVNKFVYPATCITSYSEFLPRHSNQSWNFILLAHQVPRSSLSSGLTGRKPHKTFLLLFSFIRIVGKNCPSGLGFEHRKRWFQFTTAPTLQPVGHWETRCQVTDGKTLKRPKNQKSPQGYWSKRNVFFVFLFYFILQAASTLLSLAILHSNSSPSWFWCCCLRNATKCIQKIYK